MAFRQGGGDLEQGTFRTFVRYTVEKFGDHLSPKDIRDKLETEHGILTNQSEVQEALLVISKENYGQELVNWEERFKKSEKKKRRKKKLKPGERFLGEFLRSHNVIWDENKIPVS